MERACPLALPATVLLGILRLRPSDLPLSSVSSHLSLRRHLLLDFSPTQVVWDDLISVKILNLIALQRPFVRKVTFTGFRNVDVDHYFGPYFGCGPSSPHIPCVRFSSRYFTHIGCALQMNLQAVNFQKCEYVFHQHQV